MAAQVQYNPAPERLSNFPDGLFDCFDDMHTCCYGIWCPCCAHGLLCNDIEDRGYGLHCLLWLLCCQVPPPGLHPLLFLSTFARIRLRDKYGLSGSNCEGAARSPSRSSPQPSGAHLRAQPQCMRCMCARAEGCAERVRAACMHACMQVAACKSFATRARAACMHADFCLHLCCHPCALAQELRYLKRIGRLGPRMHQGAYHYEPIPTSQMRPMAAEAAGSTPRV
jgi:Cys-rich protein (TIGR01571 family)